MGLERAVISIVRVGDACRVRLSRLGGVSLTASSIGPRCAPAVVVVPDDQITSFTALDIVGTMTLCTEVYDNSTHLVAVAEGQFSVPRGARVAAER